MIRFPCDTCWYDDRNSWPCLRNRDACMNHRAFALVLRWTGPWDQMLKKSRRASGKLNVCIFLMCICWTVDSRKGAVASCTRFRCEVISITLACPVPPREKRGAVKHKYRLFVGKTPTRITSETPSPLERQQAKRSRMPGGWGTYCQNSCICGTNRQYQRICPSRQGC